MGREENDRDDGWTRGVKGGERQGAQTVGSPVHGPRFAGIAAGSSDPFASMLCSPAESGPGWRS